jgi:hypothetical protein
MAPELAQRNDLMADLSDVENAIVTLLNDALYTHGLSNASVVGAICRVYRGWPSPAALNSDLSAGVVNVTVFPSTSPDEVLEPYFDRPYALIPPASMEATVQGETVTFSGQIMARQIVGLLIDATPFIYNVIQGDSIQSVGANLAMSIRADRPATSSGSTLTIPGVMSLVARVAMNVPVSLSLRRQRRDIQINCWSPSPDLRDAVSAAMDLAMAEKSFIVLADNTQAHLRYRSTQLFDQSQNALLYRRDLCYSFEYTMTREMTASVMLFGSLVKNGKLRFV